MSNKKLFADKLIDIGLHAPNFSKDLSSIEKFPIVIRQALQLSKGRGIIIVENSETLERIWRNNYYWTDWVNMSFELRVHILGGIPVKIFKKCWHNECDEEKFPIRTNQNYDFVLQNMENKYGRLLENIGRISEYLGENNFYSLDVGFDRDRRNYFFLEGNSAPGLNNLTANLYADFILERLGE